LDLTDVMTERQREYDLVVIGSGGGAFAGAIRARELGRSVLMVDRGTIGGTCVNVGCIPSKALLVRSERARLAGTPTLAEALRVKGDLVERLRQAKYVELLAEYGIEFRPGTARLIDPHTVAVDGDRVSAEVFLVAAGARPAVPPIPGLDQASYLTSTSTLELDEPPTRLAVIGAGPVGLELGQMLGNFGSEVTFVARRGVAPRAEPEVAALLGEVLESQGHRALAPADTTEVRVEGGEKVLRGNVDGEPFELRVDETLVASGRAPNTEGLGLEEVGVELDPDGAVVVDAEQRTTVASIYAAGDVTVQPGSSTWRPRAEPPRRRTPSAAEASRSTSPPCPKSSSPAPRSLRPALRRPRRASTASRSNPRCSRSTQSLVRSSTATPGGWSSWSPRPAAGG
jgi:mercuric reductase